MLTRLATLLALLLGVMGPSATAQLTFLDPSYTGVVVGGTLGQVEGQGIIALDGTYLASERLGIAAGFASVPGSGERETTGTSFAVGPVFYQRRFSATSSVASALSVQIGYTPNVTFSTGSTLNAFSVGAGVLVARRLLTVDGRGGLAAQASGSAVTLFAREGVGEDSVLRSAAGYGAGVGLAFSFPLDDAVLVSMEPGYSASWSNSVRADLVSLTLRVDVGFDPQ